MSLIFRLVFGTFHRAQGKPAQKRLFFRPLDTFHQFLNFPWMHFLLSHFQDMGKTVCQGCQFPDFSRSGYSWVRYKNGSSFQKLSSATTLFAATINSSMILVAKLRSYGTISIGCPSSSRISLHSGKSKSIEPCFFALPVGLQPVLSSAQTLAQKLRILPSFFHHDRSQ